MLRNISFKSYPFKAISYPFHAKVIRSKQFAIIPTPIVSPNKIATLTAKMNIKSIVAITEYHFIISYKVLQLIED